MKIVYFYNPEHDIELNIDQHDTDLANSIYKDLLISANNEDVTRVMTNYPLINTESLFLLIERLHESGKFINIKIQRECRTVAQPRLNGKYKYRTYFIEATIKRKKK